MKTEDVIKQIKQIDAWLREKTEDLTTSKEGIAATHKFIKKAEEKKAKVLDEFLATQAKGGSGEDTILLDAINSGLRKWGVKEKLSFDDGLDLLTCLQDTIVGTDSTPPVTPQDDEIDQAIENIKASRPTKKYKLVPEPTPSTHSEVGDLDKIEKAFLNYYGHEPTKINKHRWQGIIWAVCYYNLTPTKPVVDEDVENSLGNLYDQFKNKGRQQFIDALIYYIAVYHASTKPVEITEEEVELMSNNYGKKPMSPPETPFVDPARKRHFKAGIKAILTKLNG